MIVLLYVCLALEVLGVMVTLSLATKPRPAVTPGGAAFSGLIIALYTFPVVWLLVRPHSVLVTVLAAWLLASLLLSIFRMSRDIHGVRPAATPLSTSLLVLDGMVNMSALIVIITAVS